MSELRDAQESEYDILSNIRELIGAIYIQNQRIYDMLGVIAHGVGSGEDAKRLSDLHQQGQVLAPPPSFIFEENEEN
jgi:hypothetical protein